MRIRGLSSAWMLACALILSACGGGSGRNNADVSVSGTGPSASIAVGQTGVFTMTVANTGESDLTNVTVRNTLAYPLTQDSITCTAAGGAICPSSLLSPMTVSSMPRGSSLVFTITAKVASGGAAGSVQVADTMSVSVGSDADTSNNTATVYATALFTNLVVTGTGPTGNLAAGQAVTYTMNVANGGDIDLANVTVRNRVTYPLVQDEIVCTPSGGAQCPANFISPMTVPSLPKGSSLQFTINAHIAANGSGSSPVEESFSASIAGDTDTSNNTVTLDATAVYTSAAVTVAGVGPTDTVAGGSTAQFVMTVSNAGPDAATNLIIKDIPQTLQVPAITCQSTGAAVCPTVLDVHGNNMTVAQLNVGDTLVFTVSGLAPSSPRGTPVSIGNKMIVTLDNDSDTSDNTTTAQGTAYTALSGVFVSGVGPTALVPAGSPASYTMTVTNSGPDAATNLHIVDSIDSAQTFSGITCQATGDAVCPADDQLGPVMDVASLPANGSLIFTVGTNVKNGINGTIRNTMSANPDNDPNRADNTATATATAGGQDVQVSMSAPSGGPFTGGSLVSFPVAVTNVGPATAQGLTLTDTLGTGLSFLNTSCVAGGGAKCPDVLGLNMTLPSLPVSGTLNFTVSATVNAGATGQLANTFNVSEPGEMHPADNTATSNVKVTANDLSVSQTTAASVAPGTTATFTTIVYNPGPSAANNVVVNETFSPAYAFTVSCASSGSGVCPGGVLGGAISVPVMAAGSILTFTYSVPVPADKAGTAITSVVSVDAPGDTNTANNFASTTTKVVDARSGTYQVFGADGNQYILNIDFDKASYTMAGKTVKFTGPTAENDYVVSGTARFRVASDMIVGSDTGIGGAVPLPYVAVRSFLTSLLQAQGPYDLASRNIGLSGPVTHAGTASISNNVLSICQSSTPGVLNRPQSCTSPVANYVSTLTADGHTFTGTDTITGKSIDFVIARSGANTILLSSSLAQDNTKQFRIGVPDQPTLVGGNSTGPNSRGEWVAMTVTPTGFSYSGTAADGSAVNFPNIATAHATPNSGPFSMVHTSSPTSSELWVIQSYPLTIVLGDVGATSPWAGLLQIGLP